MKKNYLKPLSKTFEISPIRMVAETSGGPGSSEEKEKEDGEGAARNQNTIPSSSNGAWNEW